MALSLDDVLAGQFRSRTKTVDYGDGLVFKLHSFDAPSFRDAIQQLAAEGTDKDDCYVGLAMRAIGGQELEPTEAQIADFLQRLDKGVIEALVSDWIAFNSGAENLADAAKKS